MTTIEDRLRRDLPDLADELVHAHRRSSGGADLASLPTAPTPSAAEVSDRAGTDRRRVPLLAAAAAVLVVVVLGVAVVGNRSEPNPVAVDATLGTAAKIPTEFGTWEPLPQPPISPRHYAVSAWTGSEVVFWAGASFERNFAHTDGAALDPDTGEWRRLAVPGWGHPGLTSAFVDDVLYLLSKGFALTFDPVDGSVVDLPAVDGFVPITFVEVGGEPWALGPVNWNLEGQPDLAISRYDRVVGGWNEPVVLDGAPEFAELIAGVTRLETAVLAIGDLVVVWGDGATGLVFDGETGLWEPLTLPDSPRGEIVRTTAVSSGSTLRVIAEVAGPTGPVVEVATLLDDQWFWAETSIAGPALRFDDFSQATAAAAGDWLVVFSPADAPAVIHAPSGAWHRDPSNPLAGLRAPNAVWTGRELVVWAGDSALAGTPGEGAIWTPPFS